MVTPESEEEEEDDVLSVVERSLSDSRLAAEAAASIGVSTHPAVSGSSRPAPAQSSSKRKATESHKDTQATLKKRAASKSCPDIIVTFASDP